MVTIGPPKYNIGTQLGKAAGQGLQQGMNQGFQRGLLQQALGKARQAAQPTLDAQGKPQAADPVEMMLSLMEAGAGIPGSERYLSSLLPILLAKTRTENLYGNNAGGAGNEPSQPPAKPGTQAQASKSARELVEGLSPAGFLAPPMNPEQLEQYATQYANVLGTPEAFDAGLNQAQNLNQSRQASRAALEQAALGMGITPQELPRYMQLATNFQDLPDPQAINRATFNKYQEIKNNKESLKNLSVPGLGTSALRKSGLVGALLAGPEDRQGYLKRYDGLVKKLVHDGEEPYVREELSKLGLSPTEVEERIHPLSEPTQKALEKLPAGNKMNPQARQNSLVNFFKNNVNNDTSLTVLRRYLVKDKDYDWKEVADAVSKAFPDGKSLTGYQSAEMAELSKAPRDSLIDIFRGTTNPLDYFRGKI